MLPTCHPPETPPNTPHSPTQTPQKLQKLPTEHPQKNYPLTCSINSTIPVTTTNPTIIAPAIRVTYNILRNVNNRLNIPTSNVNTNHQHIAPTNTPPTTKNLSHDVSCTPINENAPMNTNNANGLVTVKKNVDTKSCHKPLNFRGPPTKLLLRICKCGFDNIIRTPKNINTAAPATNNADL